MLEKFSELCLQKIAMSKEIAKSLGVDKVRNEHFLLALSDGVGVAGSALKSLGIDYSTVKKKIEQTPYTLPSDLDVINPTFEHEAVITLQHTWKQFRLHPTALIYTGHLLLSLLAEEGVSESKISNLLNCDRNLLRQRVVQFTSDAVSEEHSIGQKRIFPQAVVENCSEEVLMSLTFAEQECKRLGLSYLSSEHILLGLFLQDTGVASRLLRGKTVTLEVLLCEIEKFHESGIGWGPRQTPVSPRAIRIMEMAQANATAEGSNVIETGHVLSAMLDQRDGVVARILHKLDITA